MRCNSLVTDGTIEENLLATPSMKQELFQVVLDPDATDDVVDFESGMEELKRCLKVLLGAEPVDESQRAAAARQTERVAQRERIGNACGKLLASAIDLLGEMLPQGGNDGARNGSALAEQLKRELHGCVEGDDQGRRKLNVTLPDAGVIDKLAESLARDMSGSGRMVGAAS